MLKYSINFSVKNNKHDDATRVRLIVFFNGNRPELHVSVYVKPSEWNKEASRINTNNKKDTRNKDLNRIEEYIDEIFKEYDAIEKRFPTVDELKFRFAEKKGKIKEEATKKELTYMETIELYSSEVGKKNSWDRSNYNRFKKLRNHIFYYNQKLITNKILEEDLVNLVEYFHDSPMLIRSNGKAEPGPPHKNTTVSRTLKDVRAVLRWAHKKGLYQGDLHETFHPTLKAANFGINEPVFFTWDELMLFYNYKFDIKQKHLEVTRDIVAFCCFTSLRYSDVFNLRKSQVYDDVIVVKTQKTVDALKIDINDYSREILLKYKDIKGLKALPVKSEKEINEQLKVIGSILEFDRSVNYTYFVGEKRYDEVYPFHEIISSHIGRRTFIVNGLNLGIPAEVIMKWTGHQDYQTMKPYIAIVDNLKKSEMNKFNKK
ncbi:TPA: integrase catalytic domain-containing protein [Elizabethkingia anophelis]|nr:integrase catalytic domain-containing protein [Elizabethkingia anophelis]